MDSSSTITPPSTAAVTATVTSMSSTPTTPVKGLPVAGVATSTGPQVVSVPVGLQQQLLQQQGAQIVSAAAAAGQNIAYNVMQPMQTVTVDGQEALFIPAMSLAAGYYKFSLMSYRNRN